MEAFRLCDLSFAYPGQRGNAIENISLSVGAGEFFVICGPSGSGKSTLLRQLKTELAPHGVRSGEIIFGGKPLEEADRREQSQKIGFVFQSPENQIVTDKVWHELAFGMESLGYDSQTIRRRTAEMVSFFGIESWFYKDVSELSGGQKQMLNLASVMAVQPTVLILDEPTGQLDPIAASDFLAVLARINRELGTTVILTEHRLEEAFPIASRSAVLDKGRLLCVGTPQEVGAWLREAGHNMFLSMPAAMRVWASVKSADECPVTVREGRQWLKEYAAEHELRPLPKKTEHNYPPEPAVKAEELWFRYEKDQPDVVRGLSLTVNKGELLAILGGNGAGKTTSLKLLAGLLKPQRGQLSVNGKIGLLPQSPQTLFVGKTVRQDLLEVLNDKDITPDVKEKEVAYITAVCRLNGLLERHPYDLSGGEQQRAALAKVLLTEPDILLLDEPTKGLDAGLRQSLAEILRGLTARGVTVIMVSHDIEFCARHAHRCALFFDGGIVTEAEPREFFSGNSFYTTAANRMSRDVLPDAVTPEELIFACGGTLPPEETPPEDAPPLHETEESASDKTPDKLPLWRRLASVISGCTALALFISFMSDADLTSLIAADGMTGKAPEKIALYLVFCAALLILSFSISRRSKTTDNLPAQKRRLSKRTLLAATLILLLIPLTLFIGAYYLGGRKYYFIALLILLETMLPFFIVFEGRKPQARELVIIAVLCALGVAGRAAFFMLPQFKPVLAITVIAGVALGAESGFLVGSMTMLISNIMFAQGPWTPWQMFAMGIAGFLAGVLYRRGRLSRSRVSLCVFGALCAVIVYGGIVNPAAALIWSHTLNWETVLTYYITGFPMDCVHAAATWIILWFIAEPMLEKLDRIKSKYGLME